MKFVPFGSFHSQHSNGSNFVNNGYISKQSNLAMPNFAPFESCHRELSNGAQIIKNGSILTNLHSISGKNFSRPWPK